MKTVEQLADLIVVRNHLSLLLNGTRNAIKKNEVPALSTLIQRLDTEIVQSSLEMFKDQAAPSADDVDVQKRVAEAKAKMAAMKSGPAGAAIKNAIKKAAAPDPVPAPAKAKPKKVIKRAAPVEMPDADDMQDDA